MLLVGKTLVKSGRILLDIAYPSANIHNNIRVANFALPVDNSLFTLEIERASISVSLPSNAPVFLALEFRCQLPNSAF